MRTHFFGGVHPSGKKSLVSSFPLEAAPVPEELVIPLSQHIGAACVPLVKPGDSILLGQKIGDGDGLCSPVHSSVSGTVLAVEPRRHSSGRELMSVVIKNDFKDKAASFVTHSASDSPSADEIIALVRNAGIVGMGGATFPTDVKIKSGIGKVDTLIVNACECEPYITADDALIRVHAAEILSGAMILKNALSAKRAVFATENNKPEAIAAVKAAMADYPEIELNVFPVRYPEGAEKQLIQAVTGREVPSGKLPADAGSAVFNAATCHAVHAAYYEGRPLTERVVSVTGEGVKQPKNLLVRVGTPFSFVLEAAGGLTASAVKVISGGPMMGVAQLDTASPVTKGTSAILCLTELPEKPADPVCIRCGRCVDACPIRLMPLYMYRNEGRVDALKNLHISDCIECGCCAYVCPGKLPLVESFRKSKSAVKEAAKK